MIGGGEGLSLLAGEHPAGSHDILAARGTDSGGDTHGVELIAEFLHDPLGAWTQVAVRYSMEAYEVDATLKPAYQTSKGLRMALVIVNAAPHYILHAQSALMCEVILAEQSHDRRYGVGTLHGHKFAALAREW